MIRIDEIYSNVFLPLSSSKIHTAYHWFDPYGSTKFEDLCSQPIVEEISPGIDRYVFWDQEPLHQNQLNLFLDQYLKIYFRGPTTIVHSEYNSEDVAWLENTYNLKTCYYFFHGWAALDWYRGYNRTFLHQAKKIKHTYLCPNNIVGGERQHRLELFSKLGEKNLIKNNLISIPSICPFENIDVRQLLKNNNLYVPNIDLPLKIDSYDNYANNSHQITLWDQAAKTLVHLVTETVYKGNKNHLTEKTFKPIVLQQPFILVSNQGSLKYLRKYGFKTFGDVWDESYDDADDNTRIEKIVNLIEFLENSDKQKIFEQCLPIVKHNYDWFYSGAFERVLWDELLEMINQW